MAKAGRKSKYESHVEPYLAEIEKYAQTMTEQQIAKKLGVGYRNFCDYKRKYPQLEQAIKKGRTNLVGELKSVLIEKAKGFTYTEKKMIKDRDGYVRQEIFEKRALPDVAAINLLLKNYDKSWANDPRMLELKKKELELRERQIENNEF
ncbi:hypothetical protein [Eubacterium ventriosum]|uniref:hypothetical protein n=1 Tax=Eubacterium ventriosum TaxID=39496 RepID=UPI00206D7E46|nr:hypothetical protein [Eubacterium ventriosum]DAT62208.1 MAG TPA: terminase small subunit [Caudoviricetes sp.]